MASGREGDKGFGPEFRLFQNGGFPQWEEPGQFGRAIPGKAEAERIGEGKTLVFFSDRLICDRAQLPSDPREDDRVDADRLRHDPLLQIVADQKLGEALGSQPTLSRWENAPSARDLVRLNDALLDQFFHLCGEQVRQRGEILLDIERP